MIFYINNVRLLGHPKKTGTKIKRQKLQTNYGVDILRRVGPREGEVQVYHRRFGPDFLRTFGILELSTLLLLLPIILGCLLRSIWLVEWMETQLAAPFWYFVSFFVTENVPAFYHHLSFWNMNVLTTSFHYYPAPFLGLVLSVFYQFYLIHRRISATLMLELGSQKIVFFFEEMPFSRPLS